MISFTHTSCNNDMISFTHTSCTITDMSFHYSQMTNEMKEATGLQNMSNKSDLYPANRDVWIS